jgi:putative flippase GtrA
MNYASARALLTQMVSFGLIGFVNAAVDTTVFFLALATVTGSLVVANSCAWVVAVSCSYLLNSRFTFAAHSGGRLRLGDYLMFVATQVGGFLANTGILLLAAPHMPLLFAKVLAIGGGFLVNFTLARTIVFRAR